MYESKGIVIISSDIYNVEAYRKEHIEIFRNIQKWAAIAVSGGLVLFEPVENHQFACAYKFSCETEGFCRGLAAELQSKLRREFPNMKVVVEQVKQP
jgi:hypothetical protein